jgi:predicted acylesterase/phospholipase RssA
MTHSETRVLEHLADITTQNIETLAAIQKQLLDVLNKATHEWVTFLNKETELASNLSKKMTTAQSLPDATAAYQELISRQMELMRQQAKIIFENTQEFTKTSSLTEKQGFHSPDPRLPISDPQVNTVATTDTPATLEKQGSCPDERPLRIGLALSGGGLRATFFHLGVIKFLRDAKLLKSVTHICSVSGGSILGAHLVLNWEKYTGSDEDYRLVEAELIKLGGRDIRGRVLRRWIFALLPPFPFFIRWGRTNLLESEYARFFKSALLLDLAEKPGDARPQIHILTTSFTTGRLCSFSSEGFWINDGHNSRRYQTSITPVSLAVAASSAFPPLFTPVAVTRQMLNVPIYDLPYNPEYLSDGGVFDNSGFEKLVRLKTEGAMDVDLGVLSDAGGRFDWDTVKRSWWIVARTIRATDILMKRVSDATEANAARGVEGIKTVQLKLSDIVPRSIFAASLPEDLQKRLATIRTDLDTFSCNEIALLVSHGYEVALNALRGIACASHFRTVVEKASAAEDWTGRQIVMVARSLDIAVRRRMRILDARDWVSYAIVFYFCSIALVINSPLIVQQIRLSQERAQLTNVIQDLQVKDAEVAAIEPNRISSVLVEELKGEPVTANQLILRVLRRLGLRENVETIALVRGQIDRQVANGLLTRNPDGPDGERYALANVDIKTISLIFGTDRMDERTSDFNIRFGSKGSILQFGVAGIEVVRAKSTDEVVTVRGLSVFSSASAAFQSLGNASRSSGAIIFVHGFNTGFVEALRVAGRLFYDLALDSTPAVFSWPSDGTVINYLRDVESVQFASAHFVGFVDSLREQGIDTISVIASGIGGQILLAGMRDLRSRGRERQLNQAIFVAPDISQELFVRTMQETLGVAERVTVYVNPNDRAPRISQAINQSQRLTVPIVSGVDTVIVSDRESGLFGGVSLASRAIIRDLSEVLRGTQVLAPARRLLGFGPIGN